VHSTHDDGVVSQRGYIHRLDNIGLQQSLMDLNGMARDSNMPNVNPVLMTEAFCQSV